MQPFSTDPKLNPFYYLDYLDYLLAFVSKRYEQVLKDAERERLQVFQALPKPARALYTRLLQRKGAYFRVDKLNYPEIPAVVAAVKKLIAAGFLQPIGGVRQDLCLSLRTVKELKQLSVLTPLGLSNASRVQIEQRIAETGVELPDLEIVCVREQTLMALCQHLFFGNEYQDLSEFVLSDLGLQQFEPVDLSLSPAFTARDDLDLLRLIGMFRQWAKTLERDSLNLKRVPDSAGQIQFITALTNLTEMVPDASEHPLVMRALNKLHLSLGRIHERSGLANEALRCYQKSDLALALMRQARLQIKTAPEAALSLCKTILKTSNDPEARHYAERVLGAHHEALTEEAASAPTPICVEHLSLRLDAVTRVEHQVIAHFAEQGRIAVHIENHLYPALLGLLFWEVIFTPISGAFHHPFQRGPADLDEADFVQRRAAPFAQRFDRLSTLSQRQQQLRQCFKEKFGLANPFVHWSAIELPGLLFVLDHTSWPALTAIFHRILQGPKKFRTGFPDLLVFHAAHYELIEVKGPGDRLQTHQTAWLHFLSAQGVQVSVLNVANTDDLARAP
ncbi:VRR-NUC domain-containing protein [Pseudomonadales bacterium]|nr:VRR-NUC domain-containing protein [Pseudomonadales bacterium]MDA8949930.1 VRR-NUC domain-containing protein [Pseudomonadales bacterium]